MSEIATTWIAASSVYNEMMRPGTESNIAMQANPGGPEREQIVSGLGHAEAELDRLHGAVLADDLGEIL